jgi:ribosomal protein S3
MQKMKVCARKEYSSQATGTHFISHHNISSNSAKEKNVSSLIQSYIVTIKNSGLLCSKPIYAYTSTKVTVQVFYYASRFSSVKETFGTKGSESLFSLSDSLVSVYGKEVSLTFTRIHYPYLNSYIFAQYLMHNSPSNTFVRFRDSILRYPSKNASALPASICGIKIEVSGRLVTEAVVPRVSKKTYQFGSAASALVDYSKFTGKNFLGSFTIKV